MRILASVFYGSAALRNIYIVATLSSLLCDLAHAVAPREPQSPEVDTTVEVIAVPVGGRTVIAQVVDRGTMFLTEGGSATLISGEKNGHGALKLPVCSRVTSPPDERSECERLAHLQLQKASPVELTNASYEAASYASKFYFERKSEREGVLNTYANGRSLRVLVATPDELLTRVRLLGLNATGNAVVMAESLSQQPDGTLRWRSIVSSYDERGRVKESTQLDGREHALPYGDYAVMNDKGELGLLRMMDHGLSVEWQRLTPVGKADPKAAARVPPPMPEAQSARFDFERFAQISSRLDGDEGRSSDRPISREQVVENIKRYMDARWTMSPANYAIPGLPSECRPPAGRTWQRSHTFENSVGTTIQALPYKWGGYVSVDRFMTLIGGSQLAGSVCTCTDPERNYCIVNQAAGIDCSGFVSRVWDVGRHTTVSLSDISSSIKLGQLSRGDALNKPRNHVRVFLERQVGADITFRIAESSVSCGGVCERALSARELDGYRPIRYQKIRD